MDHGLGYFEEERLGQVGDLRLWRRIMRYVLPYGKGVALAVALALIITASGLALPHIVREGIDRCIMDATRAPEARMAELGRLSLLFLAISFAGLVANFFQVVVLEWAGQRIMHSLRQHAFTHLTSLNLSYFNANPVGKLVTRITNDIQNMYEMFTSIIVTLFNEAIRLAGILVILFWMDWRLTLMLSISIPIMILVTIWFGRLSRGAFRDMRTRLAMINAFIQEAVSGASILQIFMREKESVERFSELNQLHYKAAMKQIYVFGVFSPVIELISSGAMAVIIWFGGGEMIRGHMTLGVLVAFITYMRQFFQPLREVSQKYNIVQSAMASAERVFQLIESRDALPVDASPVVPECVEGGITLEKVAFGYDRSRPVIRELDLVIRPCETLAIVGSTGAGKTTIINLLERFYDPDRGRILLDGTDLRRLDVKWLRGQIGLVMQDVLVVSGTVRENILLGLEMTDEAIARVLELSQLASVVKHLPNGLDERIGEGGRDLSAGQKQLLSFARVLARDPRILVLDEATASIDTETEILIERAIQAALADRTSIVIAHRLSTIRRADRILVMEEGRIVEEGSHEDLIAARGLYYHLLSLQNDIHGEEEAEAASAS
ncbi:MAG: ABC transporter ATP-binding protein [Syntrophobacteraceae bacterium]